MRYTKYLVRIALPSLLVMVVAGLVFVFYIESGRNTGNTVSAPLTSEEWRWLPSRLFNRTIQLMSGRKDVFTYGSRESYPVDSYPNYTCPFAPLFPYRVENSSQAITVATRFLQRIGVNASGLEVAVKCIGAMMHGLVATRYYVVWEISYTGCPGNLFTVYIDAHTGIIRGFRVHVNEPIFLKHVQPNSIAGSGYSDITGPDDVRRLASMILNATDMGNNTGLYGYFRLVPCADETYRFIRRAGSSDVVVLMLTQYYEGFLVGYPFMDITWLTPPWMGSGVSIQLSPHSIMNIEVSAAPIGLYKLSIPMDTSVDREKLAMLAAEYLAEKYRVKAPMLTIVRQRLGWYWYRDTEMRLVYYVTLLYNKTPNEVECIHIVVEPETLHILDWGALRIMLRSTKMYLPP